MFCYHLPDREKLNRVHSRFVLYFGLCVISFQPKILYVWLVIIIHLPQAHQYLPAVDCEK